MNRRVEILEVQEMEGEVENEGEQKADRRESKNHAMHDTVYIIGYMQMWLVLKLSWKLKLLYLKEVKQDNEK